jgi:hypothetical protein
MKTFEEKIAEFKTKLSDEVPEEFDCDLKVGDTVTFTNEFGVSFEGLKVIGFKFEDWFERKYNKYIYLNTSSYWFPHEPSELEKTG